MRFLGNMLIIFLLPFMSYANANIEVVQQIKKNFQDDLTNLVRKFDPQATVIVHLSPSLKISKLPGTVFSLKALELDEDQMRVVFQESKIQILTKREPEIKELEPFMRAIAKSYHIPVSFEYSFEDYAKVGLASLNKIGQEKGLMKSYWQNLKKMVQGEASTFLMFFIALIVFASLVVARMVVENKSANRLSTNLKEGFSGLNSNFTSNSMPSFEDAKTDSGSKPVSDSDRVIESLNIKSLTTILYDCYWSGMDAYARYIWNRIPVGSKEQILQDDEVIRDYVHYLSNSSEESYFNFHSSSYYLNPGQWNHLSNEAIMGLVKKDKSIFSYLSPIRKKNLNLSVSEQAEIQTKTTKVSKRLIEIPKENSPLRTLIYYNGIEFSSFEEEWQLTQFEMLPVAVMEKTLSLVWSYMLDDDIIRDILQKYSARELAQSWIGPKELLDRWSNLISEKKINLILSYIEINPANRSNQSYRLLHKEIVAKVKSHIKEQQGENNEVPGHQAA